MNVIMSSEQRKCMPAIILLSVIFLLLLIAQPANAVVGALVVHVGVEVVSFVLDTWNIVGDVNTIVEGDEKEQRVLQRLDDVSRQIKKAEEKYAEPIALAVESVHNSISEECRLMAKMNDITDTMNRITSRYRQMLEYGKRQNKLEITTLVTFAEWTVSPNGDSVHHLMDSISIALLGSDEKADTTSNIFAELAKTYEKSPEQICHTKQSAQQFIYSLYTDIALTELKGYTMMEFSWMILRMYGKGSFTEEVQLMRTAYKRRTERMLALLREVLGQSDRILWTCDPTKHEKGKTYDEVTRLLQGYVENEVDMNPDLTCTKICSDYQSTTSVGCYMNMFCSQQPQCTGGIRECTSVSSEISICPAADNSIRRYEYIENENGTILGQKANCDRPIIEVSKWRRALVKCDYCFCLCDEIGPKSDRYFNLREALTDVANNKVVTGLRMVKQNRVFHIQIQEGELMPRGTINASSLAWKPTEAYTIDDPSVRNGFDYHTLSYDSRSIDLDDIYADDTTLVVTGLKFRVIGAHLNLEARLTEFDFETGKLVRPEETSIWKSNSNTAENRVKLELNEPDDSSRMLFKSLPDSRHNQYIDFVNTSMDKDAAQSTVPFIDIQDVVSNPPVPLSGIGIYHKGRTGYGGYLAPKIMTYDFTPHMKLPEMTEE